MIRGRLQLDQCIFFRSRLGRNFKCLYLTKTEVPVCSNNATFKNHLINDRSDARILDNLTRSLNTQTSLHRIGTSFLPNLHKTCIIVAGLNRIKAVYYFEL